MDLRTEILEEIEQKIQRPGKSELMKFLKESDFFKAPASTRFHDSSESGLARHSWGVYQILKEKVQRFQLGTSDETVLVCGLFHDLCKVNFYESSTKWAKDRFGNWIQVPIWKVNDSLPLGHGEKSVIILQNFIRLTEEEQCVIRWHLIIDPGLSFNYPSGYPFHSALERFPLLTLLITSDLEQTMKENMDAEKSK